LEKKVVPKEGQMTTEIRQAAGELNKQIDVLSTDLKGTTDVLKEELGFQGKIHRYHGDFTDYFNYETGFSYGLSFLEDFLFTLFNRKSLPVALSSRTPHCRTFAFIKHPELYHTPVCHNSAHTTKCIDLSYNLTFSNSTHSRVT
jgi:hypothetical protein